MEISTRTEDGELVLCASSIYNQKFYLNKEFSKLPDEIKDELHAMLFDDIGCGLKVKKLQNEKKELFQSLELFYKIFIQGVDINSLVNE